MSEKVVAAEKTEKVERKEKPEFISGWGWMFVGAVLITQFLVGFGGWKIRGAVLAVALVIVLDRALSKLASASFVKWWGRGRTWALRVAAVCGIIVVLGWGIAQIAKGANCRGFLSEYLCEDPTKLTAPIEVKLSAPAQQPAATEQKTIAPIVLSMEPNGILDCMSGGKFVAASMGCCGRIRDGEISKECAKTVDREGGK